MLDNEEKINKLKKKQKKIIRKQWSKLRGNTNKYSCKDDKVIII